MAGKVSNNNKNVSIYVGDASTGSLLRTPNPEEDRKGLFGKSQKTESRVEQIRNAVKRKARAVIKEQFEKDKRQYFDVEEESIRRLGEAESEIKENRDAIKALHQNLEDLRTSQGITDSSQEHQDLELMKKIVGKYYGPGPRDKDDKRSGVERLTDTLKELVVYEGARGEVPPDAAFDEILESLSEDELARVRELAGKPLTHYQDASISSGEMEEHYQDQLIEAESDHYAASEALGAAQKGPVLKFSMAIAEENKEQIEADGAKEIIGVLREDAQNYVKEELEKEVEAAKEAAEEKKAEEEKIAEKKLEAEAAEIELEKENAKEKTEEILAEQARAEDLKTEAAKIKAQEAAAAAKEAEEAQALAEKEAELEANRTKGPTVVESNSGEEGGTAGKRSEAVPVSEDERAAAREQIQATKIVKSESEVDSVKAQIGQIMAEAHLPAEDQKGIIVDQLW